MAATGPSSSRTRSTNPGAIPAAVAAATLIAAQLPANAQMSGFTAMAAAQPTTNPDLHKTSRKGRRVAGAIALGLIGAAVIAGSARASYYDDGESRHERRCRNWRRWCRDGEDRACWKFENRC